MERLCLCQNLKVVLLHQSIYKHVECSLVIIILDSKTTSVIREITYSRTKVGVVTNLLKTRFTLNNCSSTFNFGYSFSEVEKKFSPNLLYIPKKTLDLLGVIILLVEALFKQKCCRTVIRKLCIVVHLPVQRSLIFRDGSYQVVENETPLRIESMGIVKLLIVDVHLHVQKHE